MKHRYGRIGLLGVALGALLVEVNKPRELATLPNTDGFKFEGHTLTGVKIPCIVRRDRDGLHYAAHRMSGVRVFAELCAWSPEEL